MSEIIGFVGMSHSPFATLLPPASADEPGGQFLVDAARVHKAVALLKPDAIVVIGPDHFHGNFYDVMPPFVLGVEEAVGFGDYGSTPGPIPTDPELAWSLYDGLTAAKFDLSLSYSLTIDHGLVQGYEMIAGGLDTPIVPIVVNTAAPPLPSMERCLAFGSTLGEVIRASPLARRVLLVGSGGLSHWLPSNDPRDPEVDGDRRAALIHGRQDARAFAAAREPKVRALGGNPSARVNNNWDEWFLAQLEANDPGPIAALGHRGLEDVAGTGGHEIRAWLIGQSACGKPIVWTSYEAVPEWMTGMGIGTTFSMSSSS